MIRVEKQAKEPSLDGPYTTTRFSFKGTDFQMGIVPRALAALMLKRIEY